MPRFGEQTTVRIRSKQQLVLRHAIQYGSVCAVHLQCKRRMAAVDEAGFHDSRAPDDVDNSATALSSTAFPVTFENYADTCAAAFHRKSLVKYIGWDPKSINAPSRHCSKLKKWSGSQSANATLCVKRANERNFAQKALSGRARCGSPSLRRDNEHIAVTIRRGIDDDAVNTAIQKLLQRCVEWDTLLLGRFLAPGRTLVPNTVISASGCACACLV